MATEKLPSVEAIQTDYVAPVVRVAPKMGTHTAQEAREKAALAESIAHRNGAGVVLPVGVEVVEPEPTVVVHHRAPKEEPKVEVK